MLLDGELGWGWLIIVATILTVPGSPPFSSPRVTCTSCWATGGELGETTTAGGSPKSLSAATASRTGRSTKRSASHMALTHSRKAAVDDARWAPDLVTMTFFPGMEYISRRAARSTGKLDNPLRPPPVAKRRRFKPTWLMESAAIRPTCSRTDGCTGSREGGVLRPCSRATTPHLLASSLRTATLRLFALLTLTRAFLGDNCREHTRTRPFLCRCRISGPSPPKRTAFAMSSSTDLSRCQAYLPFRRA